MPPNLRVKLQLFLIELFPQLAVHGLIQYFFSYNNVTDKYYFLFIIEY